MDIVQSHSMLLATTLPPSTRGQKAAKRRRRPVHPAGRADHAADHRRGSGNYGNRTQGPMKTQRAKRGNYGCRALEPEKSQWASCSYGYRTQGPMKSLRAQKWKGSRTRKPACATGPLGPLSLPASSPRRRHGWGGTSPRQVDKGMDRHSGQHEMSGSSAPSPVVSFGFRSLTPTVSQSASNDAWHRSASPMQVVLSSRPLACALVPSGQPAYVHASMLFTSFGQNPTGALDRTTISRAAPFKVSATTPKHVCHFSDSSVHATSSAFAGDSAANPEDAFVHVHGSKTPTPVARAQVSCWTPFESILAGCCITECSHAAWRGLGNMLHNALRGARIGEASHPGPSQQPVLQDDFNPYCGVRIGEAAHPGPKNSGQLNLDGLDLKAMLLPLITELIKQAVAEALGSVLPGSLNQASTRQPVTGGPVAATPPERSKGGGKKGAKQQPPRVAEAPREPKPPQPKAPTGKGRGNPAAQSANDGWQLVTRRPKDEGEFQLRAQDWTAPLVAYSSLGGLIDKAKPDEVIKGVIFATKPQLDTAHAMLRSSNKPYAMLHIYLDKGENARRIPGRVGDALRFRTAQVIQVNSATEHLTPDPKGLAAPIKVKSLQTSLVYVRIPKAFASEQTWKDFKSNAAKACMKWAGSHHIQGVDAFGWMEEQIKTTKSTQLFGLLRVPSADVGTLLGISGQKGIFVEPARRDTISVRLEWLPRTSKQESDEQYLQRALRGATTHGLGVFGNRIAWRHARVDGEVLPRIWTLSEVPRDWHSHEVNQLLEQGFKDITVLSHRLHKGTTTFRFRATCLDGDKDLVPLNAQVDDTGSSVVLWAALAPARTFQSQQRRLARGNVPHVPPDKSTCLVAVPGQAQASQEPTTDANGKEQPAAKRTCGASRQVPKDLERRPCAKEGDCAFLSVAEGLAWLASGGKGGGQKEFNHVELRARVASHLEKHRQEYESEWDSILPNGTKAQSFDEYLAAIRQLKQFASELELRALSRIYNVRVLIVPASDAFTPMVFHTNAKRMIVLWLEDKHLEFLRPTGERSTCKDYPEEYWSVTDGPVKSLKVGGSDATSSIRSGTVWSSRSSKKARVVRPKARAVSSVASVPQSVNEGTVWTSQHSRASKGLSSDMLDSRICAATTHTPSVGGAHEGDDAVEPPPQPQGTKRPRYQPQIPHDKPKRGMFVCRLCPYRRQVSGLQHLAEIRYKHCTKHHEGEGLPGSCGRKEPYVIPVTGPRQKFSWICEWCNCGVRQAVADAAREDTVARAIRAHMKEAHPGKPKHRQQKARMGISQGQKKRIHNWNAAVSKCFHKRAALLSDGFASFVWPALITARKGKPDLRLCLPRAWRCGTCLGCFRNEARARKHKCVPAWAANNRKAKLKLLSKVREWCHRHPQLHTMPQDELKVIFTLAKLALQGRDIRMPV